MVPELENYMKRLRWKIGNMMDGKLHQNLSIKNLKETTIGSYRSLGANQLMSWSNSGQQGFKFGGNDEEDPAVGA